MARPRKPPLLPLNPAARDGFLSAVSEALEHFVEPNWLVEHSPLASAYVLRSSPPERDGIRRGHALQEALTAARDAAPLEPIERAVLDATYFDRASFDADRLNMVGLALRIGKRFGITWNDRGYYRARNTAVAKLAQALLESLAPSSLAEPEPATGMIGRAREFAHGLDTLAQQRSISVIGPSGIGKTLLLASLARAMSAARRPHVWFTVRPGITGHETDLLRALAELLHAHGEQNSWLYLATQPPPLDTSKLLGIVRADLAALVGRAPALRPVLFIDEADMLGRRTKDLLALRSVVEALAGHLTLAMAGLRTVLPADLLLSLPGLSEDEIRDILQSAGILDVTRDDTRALAERTRGNGALVRTFISLHRADLPIVDELRRLQHPPTVALLLDRIRPKLNVAEDGLLQQLSVYRNGAPLEAANSAPQALAELERLALVQREHCALRVADHVSRILRLRLPKDQLFTWHLAAAHVLERHADFSEAMFHYVQGGKPVHAIRIWAEYGRSELARGRGTAALATLSSIRLQSVADGSTSGDDWRAVLVLQRTRLGLLVGGNPVHRAQLRAAAPRSRLLAAHIKTLAATIAQRQGDVDAALRQYDDALGLLAGSPEELRARILGSRSQELRVDGRNAAAATEAVRAHASAAVFHGSLERKRGRFDAAERLYQLALELCRELESSSFEEALALEHYANLLWIAGRLPEAMERYEQAMRIAHARGDLFGRCVISGGISAVHILAGHYSEARDAALDGLALARSLNYAPMTGLLACNAAEACFYLGDFEQALGLVAQAVSGEATNVMPNAYWVQAMCAFKMGNLARADGDMRMSLLAAEDSGDGYSAAVARLGLADILAAGQRLADAREAYGEALAYFERQGIPEMAARASAGLARVAN